jgi:serine/threonine-protein kinase
MPITLEVIDGPQCGHKFTFVAHDTFLVGRAECAHFRLPKDDRYISRVHFLIESNPPACQLTDLGSRNGTMVNGTRVEKSNLKSGDLIQAGKTVFRVNISDQGEGGAKDTPPGPDVHLTTTARQLPKPPETTAVTGSLPAPAPPVLPAIPGYEVLRELGRGGMGVVYLAHRLDDNSAVAIKTIRPLAGGSQQEVEHFLREARILSQLQHPGIVRFEQIGEAGELLYFVMEYVDGSDAERELKKHKRIAIRPVIQVVCQALDAIQYAHDLGYVHRDVKPSNLLLKKSGDVLTCKLADFGLARVYNSSPLSGLTMMGDIGGTLAYMPPEQITDYRHARPPADQYAAAATLYHMLTGYYIFDFADVPNSRRISRILFDPPVPIRSRRGDIPDGLDWVIERALEKEPQKRFASAAAFRAALLPFAV